MTTTSTGREFTYSLISLTYIMSERIGDSTADDSYGWIFAEVVYD